MKKLMFIAGIAAMTLASCSQEEVLSINPNTNGEKVISFRARTPNASRSVEFSTENLNDFMVYGWLGWPDEAFEAGEDLTAFFNGGTPVKFTRGEDGVFTSATPYYYPGDHNSVLYFTAFAPSTLTPTATPYGGFKIDYTVKDDIAEQEDIICAEGIYESSAAETDGDMEFDFKHALTKVYVSELRNSNAEFKIEVVGVKFGNIDMSGEMYYCGEKTLDRDSDSQNEVFNEDGFIADGDGRILWKPAGEQTGEVEYIFDTPIVLDSTNTSAQVMSGDDAGKTTNKEAFMMIPQQLKAEVEDGTIKSFNNEDSYIAFLIRITSVTNNRVIYPFADGVTNISQEVDGVTYAWAAFPVASLWVPGLYVDYLVDFSKGAGYVAPGAEEYELRPIIGGEVKFTANVFDWNAGANTTIEHDKEITVDVTDIDDSELFD